MRRNVWKKGPFYEILIVIIIAILYRVFAHISSRYKGVVKLEILLIAVTILFVGLVFYYRLLRLRKNLTNLEKEENWATLEGTLVFIGIFAFIISIFVGTKILFYLLGTVALSFLGAASLLQFKKPRDNDYVKDNLLQYAICFIAAIIIYVAIFLFNPQ